MHSTAARNSRIRMKVEFRRRRRPATAIAIVGERGGDGA